MATQYWAGGWWGQGDDEPKLEDLIRDGFWKIGWLPNEPKGERFYKMIDGVIKEGDKFALKAMAGRYHIKIFDIGEVKKVAKDNKGRIEVKIRWEKKYSEPLILERPTGEGVGNWGGTVLEIKNSELYKKIFYSEEKANADSKKNIFEYIYINSHEVNNYFSIAENGIQLENLGKMREIFFLGENGNGKTLILQSILISIYYSFIKESYIKYNDGTEDKLNLKDVAEFIELVGKNKNIFTRTVSDTNEQFGFNINKHSYNIYGYGVNRLRVIEKSNFDDDLYVSFMTLFVDERIPSLRDPEQWLCYLFNKENAKEEMNFRLDYAKRIIEELVEENIKVSEVTSTKVYFEEIDNTSEDKKTFSFNSFSAGYKNLITWVCDLVSRLAENQPDAKLTNGHFSYRGVVLIDEIDLHIHPKWAITIVRKLRHWFPEIQFFLTTHNPIVLLGASEEAVFYKVYKEKGITKISEPYYNSDDKNMEGFNSIRNYRLDQIVTSELFNVSAMPQNLRRRKELLEIEESKRTSDENNELEQLNHDIGYIPVGETKEEIKMFKLMENFTKSIEKGIQK